MTSANVSDEPIAYEDGEARERLDGIADLFLTHDRPIHMRTDDSVVRSTGRGPLLMRRSRGYVPASIALPLEAPPLLACGAELKSTFCVAKGAHRLGGAPHRRPAQLGDAELVPGGDRALRAAVRGRARGGGSRPPPGLPLHRLRARARGGAPRGACSTTTPTWRPAWPSTARPARRWGRSTTAAATAATARCGAGSCWWATWPASSAPGCCCPVRLPGGDRAATEPWRMACAWLVAAARRRAAGARRASRWSPTAGRRWRSWRAPALASPLTTSVGRLFDAVAALCGLRAEVTYEGQAAAELESLLDPLRARRLRDAADGLRAGGGGRAAGGAGGPARRRPTPAW